MALPCTAARGVATGLTTGRGAAFRVRGGRSSSRHAAGVPRTLTPSSQSRQPQPSGRHSLKAAPGDGAVPAEEEIARMRQVAQGQLEPSNDIKVKAIIDLAKQEWGLHGVKFNELMAMVNEAYSEQLVEYKSGAGTPDEVVNPPGTNTGSCKIFYLGQINGLNAEETLRMFCEHYQNVLDTPEGDSHSNIRSFMKHGWEGIRFAGPALKPRKAGDEEVCESI